MDPKLLLAIFAAALLAGIFAYTTVRWRRAPAAFRAMNYVAVFSLIAGIAIGSLATRALFGPASSEREPAAGPPAGTAPGSSAGSEPNAGITTKDVAAALSEQWFKHLNDPKWQSWGSIAQDCRLGLADSHTLRCEAARIEQDPDDYQGDWKGHHDLVPYGVVMQFCDAGFADKDSKVCVAAYRFGSKA
jgi:hypothetical protein